MSIAHPFEVCRMCMRQCSERGFVQKHKVEHCSVCKTCLCSKCVVCWNVRLCLLRLNFSGKRYVSTFSLPANHNCPKRKKDKYCRKLDTKTQKSAKPARYWPELAAEKEVAKAEATRLWIDFRIRLILLLSSHSKFMHAHQICRRKGGYVT